MTSAAITAAINWNNDGDFADANEDVTTYVTNTPGIVCERGRDQVRALAPPMAGQCSMTLRNPNTTKLFSPDYAAGALYGSLVPGRPVRVQANGSDLWRGYLDDLPQQPWLKGGPRAGGLVQAPSLGTLSKLKGVLISSYLNINITTDQAFTYVCRLAGLTATTHYVALDTGKTTLTAWWCNQSDAYAMLVSILAAEGPGAAIYESPSGVITFHSRHYRLLTARGNTSQTTFGNATTEPKHSAPFGYEPNLKGVVNDCVLTVGKATAGGAPSVVWTWTGSVQVVQGVQTVFPISLSAPATGFSVTITSTGGGLNASFLSEDGLSAASGAFVKLLLDNGDIAGQPATVTAISVSATIYTLTTETVTNSVDTSASQAKYGKKTLGTTFAPWPYINPLVARDFCNAIVNAYQEPRATVTVTVKNANSTRLAQQLAREISDRVTVVEDQSGVNTAVYIERIKHTIIEGGLFHTTEFGCEKAGTTADYFRFNVSSFNTGRFGF